MSVQLGDLILGLKVDTKNLNKVKQEIQKFSQGVNANVKVGVTKASLSTLRRQIQELGRDTTAYIKIEARKADISSLKDQIKIGVESVKPKIKIQIDSNSITSAGKAIDGLGSKIVTVKKRTQEADTQTSRLAGSIRALAAAYLTLETGKALLNAADEANRLNNRLKASTNSQEEFNKVFKELYEVTQQTAQSLQGVSQLFLRLSIAGNRLGATKSELIDIAKAFGNLGRLSGSSTEDILNASRQFSQAMGSTYFRAEEFNSVVEQMPKVIDYIAKGMGVTADVIQQMVKDGKLLSRDVFAALQSQITEINKEATKLPMTLQESGTVLTNAFNAAIGRADQYLEVTKDIGDVFKNLASLLDSVGASSDSVIDKQQTKLERLVSVMQNYAKAGSSFGEDYVEQVFNEGSEKYKDLKKQIEDIAKTPLIAVPEVKKQIDDFRAALKNLTKTYDANGNLLDEATINKNLKLAENYSTGVLKLLLDPTKEFNDEVKAFTGMTLEELEKVRKAFGKMPTTKGLAGAEKLRADLAETEKQVNALQKLQNVKFDPQVARELQAAQLYMSNLKQRLDEMDAAPYNRILKKALGDKSDIEVATDTLNDYKKALQQATNPKDVYTFNRAIAEQEKVIDRLANKGMYELAAQTVKPVSTLEGLKRKLGEFRQALAQAQKQGQTDLIPALTRNTVDQEEKLFAEELRLWKESVKDQEELAKQKQELWDDMRKNGLQGTNSQLRNDLKDQFEDIQIDLNFGKDLSTEERKDLEEKMQRLKTEYNLVGHEVAQAYVEGFDTVAKEASQSLADKLMGRDHKSFQDIAKDMVNSFLASMLQELVMNPIADAIKEQIGNLMSTGNSNVSGGGSKFGLLGSLLSFGAGMFGGGAAASSSAAGASAAGYSGSAFSAWSAAQPLAGARAKGGPVGAGKTYLVGENGPELFTSRSSGAIMNAGKTSQMMASNTDSRSVTFNIYADSADQGLKAARSRANQIANATFRNS